MVNVGRSDAEARVVFAGRQALAEVEQARDHLMAALSMPGVQSVVVECTSVSEMDVSFLQVLLSAQKTGKARGIAVSLSAPATGPLADTLARAGLVRPSDSGKGWFDPFWAGGH